MRREVVYVVYESWGEWEDARDIPYLAFADRAEANRCAALHAARLGARANSWDDFNFCDVWSVEVVRP